MTFSQEEQENYIRLAMTEVDKAIEHGNPPFGAVLIDENGNLLAAAHNTASPLTDITCHAEINIIRDVFAQTGRKKLLGCTLFINAASCSMCASAMVQAGVRDFYYGAPFEPHTDPAVSYMTLKQYCKDPLTVVEGILSDQCVAQIELGRQKQAAAVNN